MHYYENKGIHNFKRALTDRELHDFFTIMESERDYLFFMLQLIMGCRIEEVTKIQLNDIDFQNCRIALTPNKQRGVRARRYNIDIPPEICERLAIYCHNEQPHIEYADNYIFPGRTRKRTHISPEAMRDCFNQYRNRLGLHKQHSVDKDGKKRPYVRPHTLRATSINRVLRETNGNVLLAMQHSRHQSLNGFLPYLEAYKDELLKAVKHRAFKGLMVERPLTIEP